MESQQPQQEHVVYVLDCLAGAAYTTSVRYLYSSTHHVYILSHMRFLLLYLQKMMLAAARENCRVSILLVHGQLDVLLDTLTLLVRETPLEKHAELRERHVARYKRELVRAGGHGAPELAAFEVTLPEGQADLPLAFDVCVVQSCDDYSDTAHLEKENLALQQALRYVAVKHCAAFAAVSGLQTALDDANTIVLLVKQLVAPDLGLAIHLFEPAGTQATDSGVFLHLQIAPGWDTWNKILVLAKAAPELNEGDALATDQRIGELDDLYSGYFAQIASGADALAAKEQLTAFLAGLVHGPAPKTQDPPKSITYQDIVASLAT